MSVCPEKREPAILMASLPIGPVTMPAQTPAAVAAAVRRFEEQEDLFDPAACRQNALQFSRETFRRRFAGVVADALANSSLR